MKNENYLIISEGSRPIFHTIMASIAYLLTIAVLIIFFTGYNIFKPELMYEKYHPGSLAGAIIICASGIQFSRIRNIIFDLKRNRINLEWQVGPFKFGKWEDLDEISYVSVFGSKYRNSTKFEVNLWFDSNRRKSIYTSFDPDTVLVIAKEIAKKLKIDFLNSTEPHEKFWIKWQELKSQNN